MELAILLILQQLLDLEAKEDKLPQVLVVLVDHILAMVVEQVEQVELVLQMTLVKT